MAEQIFGITDTGKKRDNNEDCFIAQYLGSKHLLLAAVIDGLGGYEGGEVAAQLAKDAIIKQMESFSGEPVDAMVEALRIANSTIAHAKRNNKKYYQMACVATVALADIENNKFYYAHVGDTRLYLQRDQSLIKITKDQSFVGFLEDNGKITEDDAMRHPKRNEINKALGFDAPDDFQDYVETGESPFLPNDALLLCSDGLSDMIHSSKMNEVLLSDGTLEQKGKQLIDAANDAGGEDNITVVIVHNKKQPIPLVAHKPSKRIENGTVTTAETSAGSVKSLITGGNQRAFWITLAVVFAVLLAVFGWMLYKNFKGDSFESKSTAVPPIAAPPNAIEQLLADSVNQHRVVNIELSKKRTGDVLFTRPIVIDLDSVRITSDGISLVSDTAYHGPAFEVGPHCKYFLIDNLVMENFETGVLAKQQALHLKNVRFVNCNVPVQYQFLFPPARFITGNIADSAFRKDSIPQ